MGSAIDCALATLPGDVAQAVGILMKARERKFGEVKFSVADGRIVFFHNTESGKIK